MSVKSMHAIENFNAIREKYLKDSHNFRIIDIREEKQQAVRYGIFAIPTLMRMSPLPVRTLIGDLSDTKKVLNYLDIDERERK